MIFVDDTFTAANSTSVKSRAGETGATWTHHTSTSSADFLINNGAAYCSTAGIVYASGAPPSADYIVHAQYKIVTANAGTMSIGARLDTTNMTGYFFRLGTGGNWEIVRALNSNVMTIGNAAASVSNGSVVDLKLVVEGAKQRGYVNGVLVVETNDTSITAAGRVGLRDSAATSTSTGKHIDRITAQTLPEGIDAPVLRTGTPFPRVLRIGKD